MEQIPLFQKEQKVNPLTDPNKEPDFSLFPDSENILSVTWNTSLEKWTAIYKSDNSSEMYKR